MPQYLNIYFSIGFGPPSCFFLIGSLGYRAHGRATYGYIPYSVKKNPPRGFLAITLYHSIGEVPGSVEMDPISLPELPTPSRTPGKSQKPIL